MAISSAASPMRELPGCAAWPMLLRFGDRLARRDFVKETPQQYTKRIVGYVSDQQPLEVQGKTAARLAQLIKGVPDSKLRKRPAADKWSVNEILAHLADAEIVGGFRMRLILGAPGTPITAFDQDSWVTSGHYEK